jgi:two-component system nitrate/nitrite response regulator NarL
VPTKTVRVAILDDHQSIIDGYTYRLKNTANIELVATALYGEQLLSMLRRNSVDVLLIDLSVQTSAHEPAPYPVLRTSRKPQEFPDLKVLECRCTPTRPDATIMELGVSGYICKTTMKL